MGLDRKSLDALIEMRLLAVVTENDHKFVLLDNLMDLLFAMRNFSQPSERDLLAWKLFWRNEALGVKLSKETEVVVPGWETHIEPAFYPAVINLASTGRHEKEERGVERFDIAYFNPTRVITTSAKTLDYAKSQVARFLKTQTGQAPQFARSAHYMGSKRELIGFLVEAISSILPSDGVLLDLMCGSGVASGGFAKIWRVFASDAQEFCRLLALVQGRGFSIKEAESLIARILHVARDHASELTALIGEFIAQEEDIFHSDTGEAVLKEYVLFKENFPLYPDGARAGRWDPVSSVNVRKYNHSTRPYCLFTAYFANRYFGLRQCVEIDSLRYAIDQIANEKERGWALGALVASLSALGTTHAGHFAQPIRFDLKSLPRILEARAQSVIHDFCVRLLNLSDESERAPRPVELLPGPWLSALTALDQRAEEVPICVYVDAPYKRDEYSRYYHLLETVVAYSYPSSVGRGKIPNKKEGERFSSEFFTKNRQSLNGRFTNLFQEILKRNWGCAWSYSDSGDASIYEIVEKMRATTGCAVKLYSTPYKHNPIGKARRKEVTEYLILFIPQKYLGRDAFR